MRGIKIANFFGGLPIAEQKELLKKETPNIVVGTPGRIKQVGGEERAGQSQASQSAY